MENQERTNNQIPLYVRLSTKTLSIILGILAAAVLVSAFQLLFSSAESIPILQSLQGQNKILFVIAFTLIAAVLGLISRGFWNYKNWAKTIIIAGLLIFIIYSFINVIFAIFTAIFAGESVVPMMSILRVVGQGLLFFLSYALLPGGLIYLLIKVDQYFKETQRQREFVDNAIRYVLLGTALSCIVIVFLIFLFTMEESLLAVEEIGIGDMLIGTIWRPGSIIGTEDAQYGLLPMILGSILATFGAIILGVPLSVGTAVLLAEVAPPIVRETIRPAIELLAGIPSVVYGLFGLVVLAPLIRNIDVPRNTGFGLLNASIVLAVMIIPTITNITEDAIRAVPREYKEGSLALGGTHWQTIIKVILPAARSGIVAAVILGVGRALGETMAMIMVIGNSIAMPESLSNNPLTIFLNTARTLTGNIAVEINYAAGAHRSALFFTGVLLFIMIMLVNSTARFFMKSKQVKQ